jgi:hypothetical protein
LLRGGADSGGVCTKDVGTGDLDVDGVVGAGDASGVGSTAGAGCTSHGVRGIDCRLGPRMNERLCLSRWTGDTGGGAGDAENASVDG